MKMDCEDKLDIPSAHVGHDGGGVCHSISPRPSLGPIPPRMNVFLSNMPKHWELRSAMGILEIVKKGQSQPPHEM